MTRAPADALDLPVPDRAVARRRPEWRRFMMNRRASAAATLLGALWLVALLAPVLAPHDPDQAIPGAVSLPPNGVHPMGTDGFGRDVLSRLLWGGRVSQVIGLLSTAVSVSVGAIVGALAGYRGGIADAMLMRLTDAMVTFPTIFILVTLVAVFGASVSLVILALGFTAWPVTARLVRAELLALREREFVQAASALGAGGGRVVWRHLAPHLAPVVIVAATLRVGHVLLIEAGLSYLGLGVPPPAASWGGMVADGRAYLFHAWWMSFFPGLCIFLTVMTYNLLGDGLRDALDPGGRVGREDR
jgi:peptide/nickel transport system permease protein